MEYSIGTMRNGGHLKMKQALTSAPPHPCLRTWS